MSHSRVKAEENGRKAIFLNKARANFSVTKIDDCLVKSGLRTDYLISKDGEASALVELKGVDVSHAVDQLFESAIHPSVRPLLENRLGFLVVCSRYPKFDSYVMKAKSRAAKLHKAGFHVVARQVELDIAEVVKIDGKV